MPNLTPFEITLLVFGAVLVAALAAILWWHLAGDRVKAIWCGWLALPLLWKIVLPVVFGVFVLHGSVKRGDNVANVKVLPIANTNSQLETGNGNWQYSHTGNIQQENSTLQLERRHSHGMMKNCARLLKRHNKANIIATHGGGGPMRLKTLGRHR